MPYANNKGVKIYYEVEGEGPPLVLLHGFSGGLESWLEYGYVRSLEKDYRLVLIDIRAHGKSDKPHVPEAYLVERFVGDVAAVMDDVGVGSAHLMGYSAGGSIALSFAKSTPNRVKSMTLLAASPKRDTHEAVRPLITALAADRQAVIARMEQAGPLSEVRKQRTLTNDYEAFLALIALPKASLESDLPGMTMACLILLGEADPMCPYREMREIYKALPNAAVISLPGLNHDQMCSRSDITLPHVKQFLARVGRA